MPRSFYTCMWDTQVLSLRKGIMKTTRTSRSNSIGLCIQVALLVMLNGASYAQNPTKTFYGGENNADMGPIAGGYDLDGDVLKDVVVGVPSGSAGNGNVRVFKSSGQSIATIVGPNARGHSGFAVASPGDLNGDGHNDIIVGAPSLADCVHSDPGYVTVYLGPSFTTALYTIAGGASDLFGYSIAVIGDINGDGVPDFIVGSPRQTRSGGICSTAKGGASVFSGANGAVIYSYAGAAYGDDFGLVVGGIGDVNGDGKPDFAISNGIPSTNSYTKVYSGATGTLLYTVAVNAGNQGGSISALGDVNGDGKSDFIIGDPHAGTSFAGTVHVVSGANGVDIYTISGVSQDYFGLGTAGIGDVNGDGKPDFVASGPRPSGIGAYVKVISGGNGALLSTLQVPSLVSGSRFGSYLAAIGDIDGDGKGDFGVGTPGDIQYFQGEGSVRLFLSPSGSIGPDVTNYRSVHGRLLQF
jgi:FG-GAP repeat protein/VCBS repeat protein